MAMSQLWLFRITSLSRHLDTLSLLVYDSVMRGRKRQRKKNARKLVNRMLEVIGPALRDRMAWEVSKKSYLAALYGPGASFPLVEVTR